MQLIKRPSERNPIMGMRPTSIACTITLVLAASILLCLSATVAHAQRQVALAATTSPQTGNFTPSGSGDVTQVEFLGQMDTDSGPGPYPGSIFNRSLSKGTGTGPQVNSGKKAKSTPQFNVGFEGLNHYQQRYARGGNQFSVEPPDQGMCAGNGYVLEAVNDVLNVYSTAGLSMLPDNTATNIVAGFPRDVNHAVDLNSFYGYPPAINRSTGVRGPELTDPSCLYDAATQRWFVVVLNLQVRPNGSLTTVNHLDLAVSQTSNPTGSWNIYKIDVTNDGTNTGGVNPGPYLGDYPHIGADANGIYLTTNAYPWCCNGFSGAQIYALSKAQLVAGSPTVNLVHIDTSGTVNLPSDAGSTQPGFTVWPAQSPGAGSFDTDNGGTEFFLSSNAADEAQVPVSGFGGTHNSQQIILWTLTNTSSLNSNSPALSLSTSVVPVNLYAIPPRQQQPGSGSAPDLTVSQGHCINDITTATIAGLGCWRLLFNPPGPAHNEVVSRPDSNDTRMQQVMYSNGKLWGALDTALNPDGGGQRAGIAYFVLSPNSGKIVVQGYLGAAGYDFTYPAIGVTQSGRGVIAFTATGDSTYPSAAYAAIDALVGVSTWDVVSGGDGVAADDGFTSYKSQVGNPPRTRWGDFGAAAVDGNSIWIASEYIGGSCDYTPWGGPFFIGGTGDNLLGTCGGSSHGPGTRSALANWSTFISNFTP